MAVMLGLITAAFFAVNTGNLLATALVGAGITALFLLAPVMKRIIGCSRTCMSCGHRWMVQPGIPRPRLRVVR
jgi:hypothetical protein